MPLSDDDIRKLDALLSRYFKRPSRYASNFGTRITVNTSSVFVLPYNPKRLVAIVVNIGTDAVYINFSESATTGGQWLAANGGSIVFGAATDIKYIGPVSAISDTSTTIVVTEISEE
jgi:hypothetical protein